jgi:ABC-type glycerol-3-phosphate transport system permease component
MTAVSTLLPVTIFFLTQRYFIQGIVITGLKG